MTTRNLDATLAPHDDDDDTEPASERERCGGYTNLVTLTGGCGDCPDCDAGELEYDRQEDRGRGPD